MVAWSNVDHNSPAQNPNGADGLSWRIAQGDDQAFAQAVHLYSTRIFRFIRRMVFSTDDAEDLTQETFYALHKYRETVKPEAELLPYLMTIARRKAISWIRWRSVRRIIHPLTEPEKAAVLSPAASPMDESHHRQTEARVQQALAAISPKKRAVLILRFFEELSYREIAEIMHQPEGTVKSWVYRGEKELRKQLIRLRVVEEVHHENR